MRYREFELIMTENCAIRGIGLRSDCRDVDYLRWDLYKDEINISIKINMISRCYKPIIKIASDNILKFFKVFKDCYFKRPVFKKKINYIHILKLLINYIFISPVNILVIRFFETLNKYKKDRRQKAEKRSYLHITSFVNCYIRPGGYYE